MTLSEFLEARIAEDEAVARENLAEWDLSGEREPGVDWSLTSDDEYPGVRVRAGRVLAECAAKRQIVALHPAGISRQFVNNHHISDGQFCMLCAPFPTHKTETWPCATLLALALPFADHPDYDEGWRP